MKLFLVIISLMALLFEPSFGSHNRTHNVMQTSGIVSEIKTPLAWSSNYPLSQGIRVGNTVYLSGQIPMNSSGALVGDTLEEQVRQVFDNIKTILNAVRGRMSDIVKLNIYLQDISEISTLNEVMEQYFKQPYPARTTIGACLSKGVLVEIETIAYIDRNGRNWSGRNGRNSWFPMFE